MSRKRSPEYDYICRRCLCPCDHNRHLGGGPGMKACKGPVRPILRTEWEAEMASFADDALAAIRHRISQDPSTG